MLTYDKLFRETTNRVADFEFDENVASVFDDMVSRSVPLYEEVQNLVTKLILSSICSESVVYDVGCSTGTTLSRILSDIPNNLQCRFVGIEPSSAMAKRAMQKLASLPFADRVSIVNKPIEQFDQLDNASAVVMLYTLQFVRPIARQQVINMIFTSLNDGGMLLWAEKVLSDSSLLSRTFIDIYHARKLAAGYTDTEVSRKREALENVLVPYRDSENRLLLQRAGFTQVDTALRWCNFALYVAIKV